MSPSTWTIPTLVSSGLAWQEPPRDTVLMTDAPWGLAMATDWGLLALIVLASVQAVVLLFFVWRVDRLARQFGAITCKIAAGSEPVLERAASIADNVEHITGAVRGDVHRLTGSVRALSDRLAQASEHMETRIDEFNALLEVVQSEAEEVFLDTASAVRAVRASARALDPGRGAAGSARAEGSVSSDGLAGEESADVVDSARATGGHAFPGDAGGSDGRAG